VLDASGVLLAPECHRPDTSYVAGEHRVLSLLSHGTLFVGDSMARQFLMTCVHLNSRGKAVSPMLDFGGYGDWAYESDVPPDGDHGGRSVDCLRKVHSRGKVARAAQAAQVSVSTVLSFQKCISEVNFTRAVYDHGFWPGRIVIFAPVYWHALRHCGDSGWSVDEWAWELLARVNGTLPPGYRGLVHLVVPPLGNVREARNVTLALDGIIRPRWKTGQIYRMIEGVTTWSLLQRAYTNWHTVCSTAYVRNHTMHFYGSQDGRCAASANTALLAQLAE
jgi:hypothetical protein